MPPTSSSLYYLIGARISLCLSLPHSNELILKEEQVAWQVVEKKSRILCKCLNPTLFFFSFFLSLVGVNQKDCERQKERTTERDVRMKKGPSLERICFCCCNASVGSYKENCYSPSSSSFSFSTDGGDKRTRWGSERC